MMIDVFVAQCAPCSAREFSENRMIGESSAFGSSGKCFHRVSKDFTLAVPIIGLSEHQLRCSRRVFWKWWSVDDQLLERCESDRKFFFANFYVADRHAQSVHQV